MNYAQLRAFHAVAETGGVTRAAERLGVSQPAVTVQIKALEDGYGVELFHRINRRLVLSDLGKELLDIARRGFAAMDEAATLLGESGSLDRGSLTVGADGPYHVIAHLAAFREKFPGVAVTLAIGNSDDMLEDLLEFRTDIAVLARLVDDPRLTFRHVARHRLVVFVPRDHAWGKRRGVTLADLAGADMVLREHGSTTRRVFEAALAERGIRPHVVMEIESREAVREAVAAGLGVGVVNEAELGHDERLVALPLQDGDITTDEYVVCRADRSERRLVRAFLDMVGAMS
jgi:aminoethylphosphonate catabolism LysR family transcriptional regulator